MAGNTNPGISSAEFKIDLTDPSVEITSPANGLTTTRDLDHGQRNRERHAEWDRNCGSDTGEAATLGSGTFTKSHVALSCGSNTITAQATDEAGRTSTD